MRPCPSLPPGLECAPLRSAIYFPCGLLYRHSGLPARTIRIQDDRWPSSFSYDAMPGHACMTGVLGASCHGSQTRQELSIAGFPRSRVLGESAMLVWSMGLPRADLHTASHAILVLTTMPDRKTLASTTSDRRLAHHAFTGQPMSASLPASVFKPTRAAQLLSAHDTRSQVIAASLKGETGRAFAVRMPSHNMQAGNSRSTGGPLSIKPTTGNGFVLCS